ncbi:hypothetical protein RR48_00375 [Papilio machaon]|uniref:Uncharacterized protein n=1 Tax=Papilio machaon TaxID=76193 RepID=A0A0N1IDW7_PAPMA|nr:hypothetical protein RR48_00375 [Papilio machaon]
MAGAYFFALLLILGVAQGLNRNSTINLYDSSSASLSVVRTRMLKSKICAQVKGSCTDGRRRRVKSPTKLASVIYVRTAWSPPAAAL